VSNVAHRDPAIEAAARALDDAIQAAQDRLDDLTGEEDPASFEKARQRFQRAIQALRDEGADSL